MNRTHRVMAWITAILLASVMGAWAQTSPGMDISGTVTFTDGAPANGARVTLFDLSDLRQAHSNLTDGDGRFRIALETASSSASTVPATFRLFQNFPNPFNPPPRSSTSSNARLTSGWRYSMCWASTCGPWWIRPSQQVCIGRPGMRRTKPERA